MSNENPYSNNREFLIHVNAYSRYTSLNVFCSCSQFIILLIHILYLCQRMFSSRKLNGVSFLSSRVDLIGIFYSCSSHTLLITCFSSYFDTNLHLNFKLGKKFKLTCRKWKVFTYMKLQNFLLLFCFGDRTIKMA